MRLFEFIRTTAFRWTVVVAAAYALGMALLAGFMYWETVDYLARRELAQLRDEAQEATQGQPSDQLASIQEYLQDDSDHTKVAAIFDAQGRSLGGNLQALPAGLPHADQLGEITLAPSADSGPGRRQVRVLTAALPGARLLVIGRGTGSVHEINQIVTRALGLALLPLLLVALATGALISRSALRRIAAVHGSSRLIMAGQLSERLPTRGTGDEFDQLARIVNVMLDEIERLMLETKGVGEDIAHDLRTPLTRLRVRFERAMSAQPAGSELHAVLAAAVQDIDQILTTIAAILRIAEVEHGQRRAGFRAIDLNHVVQEAVDLYEPIAEDRRISLRVGGSRVDAVVGDPDLMFEAVSNLLDNALKFSPPGGSVSVLLQPAAHGPVIRVADDGPGIAPEDWARVGRRFFRADRSRHAEGSGLGLSLVASIVRLHGFALLLDTSRPGCSIEIQCWPQAADAGAGPPDRAAQDGSTAPRVALRLPR